MRRRFLLAILACLPLAACGGTTHHTVTTKRQVGPSACAGGYQTAYGCQAHSPTFGLPPSGPPKLTAPSSTPTVVMNDSVTVSAIPAGSPAVAGYLSGNFPTWFSLRVAFPRAIRIPVAIRDTPVYPSLVGRVACLDDEPGDAVPDQAGPWAAGERKLGVIPCVYASLRNGMSQVESSLARWLGAGWRKLVLLWDADWTGSPRLDAGFDATQWLNHGPGGENYDQNVVTRTFLGIRPAPKPPVDLGGAEHYERYPQAPSRPHRERQTVQGWDSHGCMNPVRRPVCRVTRSHLLYDLGRDQVLYRHDSRATRDALRLPGRIQGLVRRLDGRGVVHRWL